MPIIPAIVSSLFWLFFFKNEPLKFLITKAESDGKDSKAYAKALRVIGENYLLQPGNEEDTYEQIRLTVQSSSKSKLAPGYWRALTDPAFRKASWISIGLAVSMRASGINAINIFSTGIYKYLQ